MISMKYIAGLAFIIGALNIICIPSSLEVAIIIMCFYFVVFYMLARTAHLMKSGYNKLRSNNGSNNKLGSQYAKPKSNVLETTK